MFLYICPFKLDFLRFWCNRNQWPYLSNFSSSSRITFLRSTNSSSGKSLFYNFSMSSSLVLPSSTCQFFGSVFDFSLLSWWRGGKWSREWRMRYSQGHPWVGCWRMNRSLPRGGRHLRAYCEEKSTKEHSGHSMSRWRSKATHGGGCKRAVHSWICFSGVICLALTMLRKLNGHFNVVGFHIKIRILCFSWKIRSSANTRSMWVPIWQ